MSHRKLTVLALLPLAVASFLSLPAAAEDAAEKPLQSGRDVGDDVPYFYVRDVTGPRANLAVCYVCRHGNRPVVMTFARQVSRPLGDLLKQIDTAVDDRRGEGLRSFTVFINDDSQQLAGRLLDLARDESLSMPLCISARHVESPSSQNLNSDADVTVVLYAQRKVVANFAFREGELTAESRQAVLDAVAQLGRSGE